MTTIWLAYCSRSNVADCEFASILDRRIDIIPALSFLDVTVVCSIVHLAYRHPDTQEIVEHPSPIDHPLILMHLSSIPLPKQHVPRTIEFYPKCMPDVVPDLDLYVPTPSLFQLCIDITSRVTLEVEGNEVVWDITGTLPLMLLLNGVSPDDTSTVLKDIVAPKIIKEFWPRPYQRPVPGPREVHMPHHPGDGGADTARARAHTHERDTRGLPEGQPDRARGTHRPRTMAYQRARVRDTRTGRPATRSAEHAGRGRGKERDTTPGTGPNPPNRPRAPRTHRRGTAPAKAVVAHSATPQPLG